MKYFKKFLNFWKPYTLGFVKELLLVLILSFFWVSFTSATNTFLNNFENYLIATWYVENTRTSNTAFTIYENTDQVDENFCLKIKNFSWNANSNRAFIYWWWTQPNNSTLSVQVFTPYYWLDWNFFCSWWNKQYFNVVAYAQTSFDYEIYDLWSFLNANNNNYTSLQCQTEYNLIPIEDVTKNYCEVNFDLIDPLDCPSSPSWSGDVSRSALYIDNVQYSGSPNIYININDLLEYSMTYVSGSAVVDVNGYSYDTWYMADILTIQEYHPTTEDFTTSFVSFLTFALPYVVVILFVVFVRKLIRKIFKF